jgi:hypothetical protein
LIRSGYDAAAAISFKSLPRVNKSRREKMISGTHKLFCVAMGQGSLLHFNDKMGALVFE